MADLIQKIDAASARLATLIKQSQNTLNGNIGNLAALNTANKTSIVLALNELKTLIDSYTQIDDATNSANKTWSSNKINASINSAITQLINGADVNNDSLKDLADRITANFSADASAVSVAGAQSFTAPQQEQARANIGAQSSAEIGDIASADFVATINSAYANGV